MKKILLSVLLCLVVAFTFSQSAIRGFPRQRNIIFEGNSLSNFNSNSSVLNNHYVPRGIYDNQTGTYHPLAFTSFAISGRNQTQINASITSNIAPLCKKNDVIFLWEGTNDLNTNALSAAAAYANVVTYIQTVQGYGAVVIVGTVLARDFTGDAADLMTRIDSYNALVRSGAATYGYTVCDLAADPLFDTRADASNATYYNGDKLHQTTAGQDRVITLASTTMGTVLASLAKEEMQIQNIYNDDWNKIFILISIGAVGYHLSKKKEDPEYRIAA
jgi:hypothetical protein